MIPTRLEPLPPATARAVAFALASGRHRHVALLIDLYDAPRVLPGDGDTPVELIVGRADGVALTAWLSAGGDLSSGEAVTILIPLLGALQHLDRRGVDVSGTGLDDVVIDDEGAPVLVTPRGGTGSVEQAAGTFVHGVLARVGDELPTPPAAGASLDDLVEYVSDLGAPVPLATATLERDEADLDELERVRLHPEPEFVAPVWLSMLPESPVLARLVAIGRQVSWHSIRAGLESVRPRYWSLAGILAASLVTAIVVSTPRGDPSSDVASASGEASVPVLETASAGPTGAAIEGDSLEGYSSSDDSAAGRAIVGPDPSAAGEALVAARRSCLREPTTRCFDDTDQPGSPLAAVDVAAVDDPALVVELIDLGSLGAVRHRLGDTVLLDARTTDDEPASVLMVRTEAGWRLREISVTRG